jgi:urease accessory protein
MTDAHAVPAAFDAYRDEETPQAGAGTVGKDGVLEARFEAGDGETYLAHDFTRTPCHLAGTVTLDDPLSGLATAYIQTPSGGIAQGDSHRMDIEVGPGARARVTTQSATKVFGMDRNYGRMEVDLSVASGGYLEYLPDPTILHQDARYAATCSLDVGSGATALVGDVVVPGRLAHEEAFAYDRYYSQFEARTPDGLAASDTVHLADDDPCRPGVFGEYTVLGSLYVISPALDSAAVSDRIHERVGREELRAGATALPNDSGIIVRLLGHRTPDVTDVLSDAWSEMREILFGVETPKPRKY